MAALQAKMAALQAKMAALQAKMATLQAKMGAHLQILEPANRGLEDMLPFRECRPGCVGAKDPIVIKSWRRKLLNPLTCFKYPNDIRRVIYTTKGAFPTKNSLRKLLHIGLRTAYGKLAMALQNRNSTVPTLDLP